MGIQGTRSRWLVNDEGRECTHCGKFKVWDDYAKASRKASANGHSSECKLCHNDKAKSDARCLDCGEPVYRKFSRCKHCAFKGSNNPAWRGGRQVTEEGYIRITTPDGRRMYEHRYVMEQQLGRLLYPHEDVHHKHGVRDDNRPEKLELWSTSQPRGQRVEDKIEWAVEFLAQYGYDVHEPNHVAD